MLATPPGGEPWPGEGRATFEWHESGAHLIERSTVDMPEAPDGVSIIGCDAANGTYYQLYSDDRGVCRVYEMSIGDGEWKLWREGEPFPQRFTGRFADDARTIVGRWEKAEDGANYRTDFDLTYTRVEQRSGSATGSRQAATAVGSSSSTSLRPTKTGLASPTSSSRSLRLWKARTPSAWRSSAVGLSARAANDQGPNLRTPW